MYSRQKCGFPKINKEKFSIGAFYYETKLATANLPLVWPTIVLHGAMQRLKWRGLELDRNLTLELELFGKESDEKLWAELEDAIAYPVNLPKPARSKRNPKGISLGISALLMLTGSKQLPDQKIPVDPAFSYSVFLVEPYEPTDIVILFQDELVKVVGHNPEITRESAYDEMTTIVKEYITILGNLLRNYEINPLPREHWNVKEQQNFGKTVFNFPTFIENNPHLQFPVEQVTLKPDPLSIEYVLRVPNLNKIRKAVYPAIWDGQGKVNTTCNSWDFEEKLVALATPNIYYLEMWNYLDVAKLNTCVKTDKIYCNWSTREEIEERPCFITCPAKKELPSEN